MLQFHLVRRSEPHCRSVVSNWRSNLADCHLFWNVVVGCGLTVLRAELLGTPATRFVVTEKTQPLDDTDDDEKKLGMYGAAERAADPRTKVYAPRAPADPIFPWRHVGVHVASLMLSVAACAVGATRMFLRCTPPLPWELIICVLWCAHNALPLVLLLLRTLHGDSMLLKYCCRWLPRAYLLAVAIVAVCCGLSNAF